MRTDHIGLIGGTWRERVVVGLLLGRKDHVSYSLNS